MNYKKKFHACNFAKIKQNKNYKRNITSEFILTLADTEAKKKRELFLAYIIKCFINNQLRTCESVKTKILLLNNYLKKRLKYFN